MRPTQSELKRIWTRFHNIWLAGQDSNLTVTCLSSLATGQRHQGPDFWSGLSRIESELGNLTNGQTNPESPARLTRRLIMALVCIVIFSKLSNSTISAVIHTILTEIGILSGGDEQNNLRTDTLHLSANLMHVAALGAVLCFTVSSLVVFTRFKKRNRPNLHSIPLKVCS